MMINDAARRLLELCAVRVNNKSLDWSLLARCARSGGLDQLYSGVIPEDSRAASQSLPVLHTALSGSMTAERSRVDAELHAAEQVNANLVTVLDPDYPINLSRVPDLPPFIFVRGALHHRDVRAVAVVGTRGASELGLSRAGRMSRELVAEDVTVVSGLARGIDTAAHTSALEHGGRTIAVIGTGVTRCYPAENLALADRVADHGAVVSQFWPTRAPGRDTFPRRNRVTSGMSQGTVVIEASRTSGAKMQARLAHEHGKRVWLIHSLVAEQDWARRMVDLGHAKEISTTGEVLDDLLVEDSLISGSPGTAAQLALELK